MTKGLGISNSGLSKLSILWLCAHFSSGAVTVEIWQRLIFTHLFMWTAATTLWVW